MGFLGIEQHEAFLSFELAATASKLVTQVIPIHRDQDVVITADTKSDLRVVEATAKAIHVVNAQPTVIWYKSNPFPCMDPPSPVAEAIKAADIWIEYASVYTLYSKAYQLAINNGCRYLCLSGMDAGMMVRMVGNVDYPLVESVGKRLHKVSQGGKWVHITSPAGTDVSVKVNPEISPFDKPPEQDKGYAQMLAGQASFNIFPNTFEGTLVLDGTVWPPEELGLLQSPIELTFEKGKIVNIDGDYEALMFRSWLESFVHPAMLILDHVCYGFNPGVKRLSGRILEDERYFGSFEFGIGNIQMESPSHTDGVILSPSVWVDNTLLEKEGIYMDAEIAEMCRQLGMPEY